MPVYPTLKKIKAEPKVEIQSKPVSIEEEKEEEEEKSSESPKKIEKEND